MDVNITINISTYVTGDGGCNENAMSITDSIHKNIRPNFAYLRFEGT